MLMSGNWKKWTNSVLIQGQLHIQAIASIRGEMCRVLDTGQDV